MTGFEYDANPFNGWDVDGNPATDEGVADRRVVWGVESPELLLTEAIALHDRRVADKADDTGPSNNDRNDGKMNGSPDMTLDQVHAPQGSVFFELLSARSANPARHYPTELYQGTTLDLGRMATDGTSSSPVWRIAITESISNPNANLMKRVMPEEHPDLNHFGPIENGFDGANLGVFQSVGIERVVVFTQQPPNDATGTGPISYINATGMPTLLNPGQIALIGPRPSTAVGTDGSPSALAAQQRIQLQPTVEFFNQANPGGYFVGHPTVPQPLPIVCSSAVMPAGWAAGHFARAITRASA